MNDVLKTPHQSAEPSAALRLPVEALLGVSPRAAELLGSTLHVRTIYDLATCEVFGHARTLVDSAAGVATEWSKCGLVPSGVMDGSVSLRAATFDELAQLDVQTLVGIGPVSAPQVREVLDLHSVRDLALWPPYLNARALLREVSGDAPPLLTENETPADLLPLNGRFPTERTQYTALVFDKLLRSYPLQPLEAGVMVDVLAVDRETGTENNPAFGALLTYTQSWYTLGLTLGQLLHSLALAPGESTRVAVVDWQRRLSSAMSETDAETQTLVSDMVRTRSIDEVVRSVATDLQRGNAHTRSEGESNNFGVGFGTGSGSGTTGGGSYAGFSGVASAGSATGIGISYGQASGSGEAWTWSASQGKREVGAEMAQRITDRTHQASMTARNRWASVVREVSQSEHETLSTRAVTNFNHMHALTVQYYEVVQLYRVEVELSRVSRCLFLPMRQLDFTDDAVVLRFRAALAAAARSPAVRLLGSGSFGSLYVDFPSSRAVSAVDRANYLRWGTDHGVQADTSARALILPGGCGQWQVMSFRLLNPSGTKPEDFVFKALVIEMRDHAVIEVALTHAGGGIQSCDRAGFVHPTRDFPLSNIRRMWLRRANGRDTTTGAHPNLDVVVRDGRSTDGFLMWGQELALRAGEDKTLVWSLSSFDASAWNDITAALEADRLYYSQVAWRAMDPAALSQVLSGYSLSGKPLLDRIDIRPLGVAGSYLIFPLHSEDSDWQQFIHERGLKVGMRRESIVPLPSGGVFAEAVLGRSNGAEKLDITRFWNWSDSPIPVQASDIAALEAGSRANLAAEGDTPQGFGAPLLNIVNPPAMPDATGLAAVLAAIQNGNMFRDMSGLAGAIGLAQSSLTSAMKAAEAAAGTAADEAKSAMAQAGKNLETAAKAFESVYGKGGSSGGSSSGGASSASKPTSSVSELGAKFNAASKLDKEAGGKTSGGATTPGATTPGAGSPPSATGTEGTTRRDQVLGTDGGLVGGTVQLIAAKKPGKTIEVDRAFDGERPNGIDVSDHQKVIDWAKVRAAGVRFAFIKATEGLHPGYRKVESFTRNWSGAADAGIIRGAYHYYRPEFDAKAQAEYFLRTVGEFGSGVLPPTLDVEHAEGLDAGRVADAVQVWCDTVFQHYGLTPIIYTYPSFWTDKVANTDRFKEHMLWISNVEVIEPSRPAAWPTWDFWQYTYTGRIDGITTPVDLDLYNGTLLDLCRIANYDIGIFQSEEKNWI